MTLTTEATEQTEARYVTWRSGLRLIPLILSLSKDERRTYVR